MRQRHKDESQKKEKAEQGVQAGPGHAGKQRTSAALSMLGSGPAHREILTRSINPNATELQRVFLILVLPSEYYEKFSRHICMVKSVRKFFEAGRGTI